MFGIESGVFCSGSGAGIQLKTSTGTSAWQRGMGRYGGVVLSGTAIFLVVSFETANHGYPEEKTHMGVFLQVPFWWLF